MALRFSLTGCLVLLLIYCFFPSEHSYAQSGPDQDSKSVISPSGPPSPKRSRQNLELVVLGILVGLILKSSLDITFAEQVKRLSQNEGQGLSVPELIRTFWTPRLFLFCVFLFTLLRWVYGAYRFHEALPPDPKLWVFFVDAIGMIGLFVLFYLAGMSVRSARPFYIFFLILHAWDFIWFLPLWWFQSLPSALNSVAIKFIAFDLLTLVLLGFLLWYLANRGNWLQAVAGSVLILIGIMDFICNYAFYFSESWQPDGLATALLGPDHKTTIYFAGPLFTQAEWQWNMQVAEGLRQKGFQVILPQEAASPILKKQQPFDARKLFEGNVNGIERSNVVVAILDGADVDSGTSWECGYAFKAGVPVVGLRTDLRPGGDDPKRPVNLMLSQSCQEFFLVSMGDREDSLAVANRISEAIPRAIAK